MGLISRVSSRTYRKKQSDIIMAKGARNKKRQKARNVRREKFAPRELETLKATTPKLETLREQPEEKKNNQMDERSEEAKKFDEKTKKNADGNYAPWLTQRDRKKLIRANNQQKNKKKNTDKRSSKKMK